MTAFNSNGTQLVRVQPSAMMPERFYGSYHDMARFYQGLAQYMNEYALRDEARVKQRFAREQHDILVHSMGFTHAQASFIMQPMVKQAFPAAFWVLDYFIGPTNLEFVKKLRDESMRLPYPAGYVNQQLVANNLPRMPAEVFRYHEVHGFLSCACNVLEIQQPSPLSAMAKPVTLPPR
jgi:hypothetical protein